MIFSFLSFILLNPYVLNYYINQLSSKTSVIDEISLSTTITLHNDVNVVDDMLSNIRFDIFNITSAFSSINIFDNDPNRADDESNVTKKKVRSKKLRYIDCIISDCSNLTKLTYKRKPFILKNYSSITSWPVLSWDLWNIATYRWIYLENVLTIRSTAHSNSMSSNLDVFCTHVDSLTTRHDDGNSNNSDDDEYLKQQASIDNVCKRRPKTLRSMLLLDLLHSLRSFAVSGGDTSVIGNNQKKKKITSTVKKKYLYSTNYRSLEHDLQVRYI